MALRLRECGFGKKFPAPSQRLAGANKCSGISSECMQLFVGESGAGEGNRTLVCSLGSCRSTIELRPHISSFHAVTCCPCLFSPALPSQVASGTTASNQRFRRLVGD